MAKIKTVTVTLSRRVSDGNYGSFGADVTLAVELEEGDTSKEVRASVLKSATVDLERALEEARQIRVETSDKKKK